MPSNGNDKIANVLTDSHKLLELDITFQFVIAPIKNHSQNVAFTSNVTNLLGHCGCIRDKTRDAKKT